MPSTKPALGTALNLSHALIPDHAWMFQEGSGASVDRLTGVATASVPVGYAWATGAWGPCAECTSVLHKWSLVTDASTVLPTTAMTAVLAYKKTDGSNRNSSAFGVDTAIVAEMCGALCPYGDGKVYWDFGGFTEGTSRLSVGGLSFGDDLWIFTSGARGMEIWQNGTKRASNAATPTRSASTAAWTLGKDYTIASDVAQTACLYTYNRQLSEANIASLFTDPFQWFVQPASVVAYRHGHRMVGTLYR